MVALLLAMLAADPVTIDLLPPGPGNPRNTEGSFVALKDGRILFVYSKFTSDGPADSGAAVLAARYSRDNGTTWSTRDEIVVGNEAGMNVMSVSLLRLRSGAIALFYARKNSMLDCRVWMRISKNEGRTWGKARLAIPDAGYYVLNNDRAIQLASGRILLPVAYHHNESPDPRKFNGRGVAMCYLSDDQGKSWRRSHTVLENPAGHAAGLQEPGIVVLRSGQLLMYMRTGLGRQYFSYSNNNGDSWTPAEPSSLLSPLSPASIKRIPQTGDLLAVWNDHTNISGERRTPLTVAISRDEGQTWERAKSIAGDPRGWYCYTAIHFAGDRVVLSYNAGGAGLPALSKSVITYFDVEWLYQ